MHSYRKTLPPHSTSFSKTLRRDQLLHLHTGVSKGQKQWLGTSTSPLVGISLLGLSRCAEMRCLAVHFSWSLQTPYDFMNEHSSFFFPDSFVYNNHTFSRRMYTVYVHVYWCECKFYMYLQADSKLTNTFHMM